MNFEECKAALGKQIGVAFRIKGRREIPQDLFEYGFIEYDRSPIFSFTQPRDINNYTRVIFDKGELKGKVFEFTNKDTNRIDNSVVETVVIEGKTEVYRYD